MRDLSYQHIGLPGHPSDWKQLVGLCQVVLVGVHSPEDGHVGDLDLLSLPDQTVPAKI